jgi:hypothetical protein
MVRLDPQIRLTWSGSTKKKHKFMRTLGEKSDRIKMIRQFRAPGLIGVTGS